MVRGSLGIFCFVLIFAQASAHALDWVRKPFLQQGSPNSAMVCWRLDSASKLTLRFGKTDARTEGSRQQAEASKDGCLQVPGLVPGTKYFYSLHAGDKEMAAGWDYFWVTHPVTGKPGKYFFWIIGDAGTGNDRQMAAKDAFLKYNGGPHSDGFLMLGDNAYDSGYDAQFTEKLFTIYRHSMRNTFTWPTIGNHENYSGGGDYLKAFYLPTEGQSGGVPSKNELYYSFDYGNVHFICLDSEKSSKLPADPMRKWLEQDLQATRQDWIIAYFHHPPYTMGNHNSDSEQVHADVRKYFLPTLEKYGVDMVFSGHSHDYERSFLLNGAYGDSRDNVLNFSKVVLDHRSGDPAREGPYQKATGRGGYAGTVYTVAGSSGKVDPRLGDHPLMKVFLGKIGTVILRIEDNVADARMLDDSARILDHYQVVQPKPTGLPNGRIRKGDGGARPLFTRQGRRLRFPREPAAAFALYSADGKVLIDSRPAGFLTLAAADFPDGEYFFRYGNTAGSMVLP
jgi:acid phosphatase type 7